MQRDDLVQQARAYVDQAMRLPNSRRKKTLLAAARRLFAMRAESARGLTLVTPLEPLRPLRVGAGGAEVIAIAAVSRRA